MSTNSENQTNQPISKDESVCPDEWIKAHADDPNHVITDEQINNLRTGEECERAGDMEEKTHEKEEELKDQTPEDELPNPYNVLGS